MAFGLALACKVTTAAYLGLFALALVWCARDTLTWRRSAWAAAGALGVGVALQTSLFTDGHGLVAWGHQFVRSFAVASGNADTLPLTNPGYWDRRRRLVGAPGRGTLAPAWSALLCEMRPW